MKPALFVLLALLASQAQARTWNIKVDGSGDAPTIQAGIDSAAVGDTVLVSAGTYDENLDTDGKSLSLVSKTGPEATILDGGDRASVVRLHSGDVVEGFSIRNGHGDCVGGGIWINAPDGAVIRNNVIEDNTSGGCLIDSGEGGGVYVALGSRGVVIEANIIRNNFALYAGAGIYNEGFGSVLRGNIIFGNEGVIFGGGIWDMSSELITMNLIQGNTASWGAGVYGFTGTLSNNTIIGNNGDGVNGSFFMISNNIVTGNQGIGIPCPSDPRRIRCNDSWGNLEENYFSLEECDTTRFVNFSLDPLFCDEGSGDFQLSSASPCAPSSDLGCGLVGAFSVACGPVPVLPTTWGQIKARYGN